MSTPRGTQGQPHLASIEEQRALSTGTRGITGGNTRQWSRDVQEEFQTFYQENLGLIYRYIYSKVGNREEAEDLASQTFVKAVHSIDRERDVHPAHHAHRQRPVPDGRRAPPAIADGDEATASGGRPPGCRNRSRS